MKLDLKRTFRTLTKSVDAHKPELLTGMGVAMMLVAIPLTIVATVKASNKVEEKKEEIAKELLEKSEDKDTPVDVDSITLPAKEIVKATWKYYIPTVVIAGLGAFCSVSSVKEGLKRTAAMAAAYQLSESAFNEFRNATKEVVGDKKENEIQQKLMKDRMELMTDDEGHVVNIYDTRDGTQLCFDYWSGRYFYSDVEYIRSQINRVNECILQDAQSFQGFASLNDVYRAVGLPETGIGDSFYWTAGYGNRKLSNRPGQMSKETGIIRLKSSTYITVDDRPCWVMAFENPPEYAPPWMVDQM